MKAQDATQNRGWIIGFWLYFLLLVLISVGAYLQALPENLTQQDKLGHFILLGLAGFLGHQALGRRSISVLRVMLPLGPSLATVFSTIDEFLQLLSTTRSFDLVDLWSNWIGIWLFYAVAETAQQILKKRRSQHK
ncbi:VanZ family protein [Oscillatoria amoena NRMC-F 0135]|nr:VanZ family protein [Geitlerinema splendidum]MDL5051658.1 VanZ family protein [Oscillatoria amoena NRMC-F 0135]